MIIDVHGHFVPRDPLAAIRKEGRGFPSLRLIDDGGNLAIALLAESGHGRTGFPGAMISTLPRGNRQCARRRRPRSVLGGSG
jgi:hypothetical protein